LTGPDAAEFRTIVPPVGRNYADPFIFERDGKHYLFFEEWGAGPKGVITCIEIGEDGEAGEPEVVLERPYHLSYPQVFECSGDIYLLPETSRNNRIELYRASNFPTGWQLAEVLVDRVPAVDATLLQHGGKFWLFAAGVGGADLKLTELSLFYADSLFGKWKSHPKNPIVCDIRCARPAGRILSYGSQLIRPGQDCSTYYGYAVSLNRIERLTEYDYRETHMGMILPNWMPGIYRTHTLNQDTRFQVLDAKGRLSRGGRQAGSQRVSTTRSSAVLDAAALASFKAA
jgi:hypothetical protein